MRRNRWGAEVCVAALALTLSGCVHRQPVKYHAKKAAPREEGDQAELEQIARLQAQMDAMKAQMASSQPPPEVDPIATPPPPPPRSAAVARPTYSYEMAAPAPLASPTGQQVNQWYNGLSNGLIEYSVPSKMYVGDEVTVSVRIHGTQSKAPTLAGRSGTAMVKVSTQMQAQLGQSANPDEFVITPADPVQKTVVDAGDNTWTWTVKPVKRMTAAQLDIQLWVLYPGQEAKDQVPVVSTTIPVVVSVPPLPVIVREVVPQDPQTISQQLFPKGIWAAFGAALLWIVHWVQKRFGKQAAHGNDDGPKV